jgi:serine/threonine-protein kinase
VLSLRLAIPKILSLGLLLLGALSLPPLELPQRLDRALFDLWTRLAPPTAPTDMLVVEVHGAGSHTALLETAAWQSARLVVTTLADKPSLPGKGAALGPVAVASAAMPILRETAWRDGGYLWTRADIDGTVRFERPSLGGAPPTPSLAFAAAAWLKANPAAHAGRGATVLRLEDVEADRFGRRWLRFFDRDAFAPIGIDEIGGQPNALRDKIVIVGDLEATPYPTPVGSLAPAELLAHGLAGYRLEHRVRTGPWLDALAWLLGAACVAAIAFAPPSLMGTMLAPIGSALGLQAAGALGFTAAGVWLPVAAPSLLVLALSGLTPSRDRGRAAPALAGGAGDQTLLDARRLASAGALEQAWAVYRRLPIRQDVLGDLYELADALAGKGEPRKAADLFHRMAQAHAGFKDVTARLVAASCREQGPSHGVDMPKTLGRYQILGRLGRGAMGVVYLGRDPAINRIVAIKAIHFEKELDPGYAEEARGRFVREAETAGRLSHPSIVTIYDVGEESGVAYIAMEYVCGIHLSDHCEKETLLPIPMVLDLLARTADALAYAHSQNVVHRDIKPANIMYDSATDSLKITDFGIARLMDVSRTRTGIVLGTPSYMSPEQLQGENVNGHTDLFALGVNLYQLLTSLLPFRGTSMTQLMFVITNEPHVPVTTIRADLPPDLDEILDRALAKQPADRYQTGGEMARALRAVPARAGG